MEKFLENLQQAEIILQRADHIMYVSYSLVKDKRLLLNVLCETKNAIVKYINSILQYEYIQKKISLYKNPKDNLITFYEKSSKRFMITPEENKQVKELFRLVELHNKSPFEFAKDNYLVIMSENFHPQKIGIEDIKNFLNLAKSISRKTKKVIFN